VTAFTQFIGWAPIQGVPSGLAKLLPASWRSASFGMPTGLDEQYTWMSLATLVGFVMIALDMMAARRRELAPVVPLPATAEAAGQGAAPTAAPQAEAEEKGNQPVWRERMERRKRGKRRRNSR
jgi:hypothetical protein